MKTKKQYMDVSRRHPIYQKMKPLWDFYRDSYKGGDAYIPDTHSINPKSGNGSYLFQHDAEKNMPHKFVQRHERSIYPNYCRLPINTYTKYIFSNKQPITRTYNQSAYASYLENVDLHHHSMNAFMKKITAQMLIYGICYILVDKAPIPPSITTLEQQNSKGLYRAYANLIPPQAVVDWSKDTKTGLFNWVLIQVDHTEDQDPFKARTRQTRYYLWTQSEVLFLDDKGCLVDESSIIPHSMGYVPIFTAQYTDVDEDGIAESMIADIALINREIYNVYSLYQEELYKIAFAMLMKPKAQDDFSQDMSPEQQVAYLSNALVLEYPEGSHPPSYLAPPVQALVEKRAYINELILKILQLSNLGNIDQINPSRYPSGLALSFAYNDTYFTVAQMAAKLQTYETQIWRLIEAYDKSMGLDGSMQPIYPTEYDVQTLEQKTNLYNQIKTHIHGSPTLQQEADKAYYSQLLKVSEHIEKQIDAELEEYYSHVYPFPQAANDSV